MMSKPFLFIIELGCLVDKKLFFFVKICFGKTKFYSKFVPPPQKKKRFTEKNLGYKYFWCRIFFWGQKKFGSEIFWGKKKIWVKKICVEKIFGSKKIWGQNNLG